MTDNRNGGAAYRWWGEWRDKDRGAFARLRRADLVAAMFEAATVDLHRDLGRGSHRESFERTALCAAVLASVREHRSGGRDAFAKALGTKVSADGPALFSATRAMGLRRAVTPLAALPAFRRAVAILGGMTDVGELAATVLDWCDPFREVRVRRDFAFAYHGAAFEAGDTDQPEAFQ